MTTYGIREYPPERHRVDVQKPGDTHWIGFDVTTYADARALVDTQPDTGHRFRIVRIRETVEWESPEVPVTHACARVRGAAR